MDYLVEMKKLLCIIPTVSGREHCLGITLLAYCDLPGLLVSTRIRRGYPTCGEAWNSVKTAEFDYIHFGADDLMPLVPHKGFPAAIKVCDSGELPGAFVYNLPGMTRPDNDGKGGDIVQFPRVPFLSREQWKAIFPIPPLHYFSDVWIGMKADSLGIKTRLVETYSFAHSWADEGRIRNDARDRALYERELAKL